MERRSVFAGAVGAVSLVIVVAALIIGAGFVNFSGPDRGTAQPASQVEVTATAPAPSDQPAAGDTLNNIDAVSVVERVAPAVVTVINLQRSQGMFGNEGDPQQAGSGTGFIIDDQGHIVTNWHVVAGGDQFNVVFADGTERSATLIGEDNRSDLAVVQIEGDLPATVPFGDPDQLRVGQPVLAIGSPLGAFTNTVTQGIISALNRDFPDDAGLFYTNLVQHDAAINPGNSGGPLFNAAGEVIGVNTLGINQLPERGPVQGLFFAIPVDRVASVVAELIENGEVNYPALGIGGPFRSVNEQVASQFDLRVDHGLYFTDIVPGGPADEAGMEGGDIILAINGEEIDADTAFSELLFAFEPGDTVTVTVQRGDEQLDFEVTLTSTAELDE